jgi:hypothetical protein
MGALGTHRALRIDGFHQRPFVRLETGDARRRQQQRPARAFKPGLVLLLLLGAAARAFVLASLGARGGIVAAFMRVAGAFFGQVGFRLMGGLLVLGIGGFGLVHRMLLSSG